MNYIIKVSINIAIACKIMEWCGMITTWLRIPAKCLYHPCIMHLSWDVDCPNKIFSQLSIITVPQSWIQTPWDMKAHHLLSLSGFLTMHQLLTNILCELNTTESLSSVCGIFFVLSGLLEVILLKFIGHSMVDSIQISSVKTAISGLQSFGSHGEPTEPYRYLIRVSQCT